MNLMHPVHLDLLITRIDKCALPTLRQWWCLIDCIRTQCYHVQDLGQDIDYLFYLLLLGSIRVISLKALLFFLEAVRASLASLRLGVRRMNIILGY